MSDTAKIVVTFGADPEIVVANKGSVIPSWELGFVKGEKNAPDWDILTKINKPSEENTIGILRDGPAIEFNYKGPKHSTAALGLRQAIRAINYLLVENKIVGNAAILEEYKINKKFRNHQEYLNIGCDPDYDAYNVISGDLQSGIRPRPDPEMFGDFRFCGGHIHIGATPEWPIEFPKEVFVKFLDIWYFSLASIYGTKTRRREYYGKPGIFRDKTYGVEYRTPSNAWVGDQSILDGLDWYVFNLLNSHLDDKVYSGLTKLYRSGVLDEFGTTKFKNDSSMYAVASSINTRVVRIIEGTGETGREDTFISIPNDILVPKQDIPEELKEEDLKLAAEGPPVVDNDFLRGINPNIRVVVPNFQEVEIEVAGVLRGEDGAPPDIGRNLLENTMVLGPGIEIYSHFHIPGDTTVSQVKISDAAARIRNIDEFVEGERVTLDDAAIVGTIPAAVITALNAINGAENPARRFRKVEALFQDGNLYIDWYESADPF